MQTPNTPRKQWDKALAKTLGLGSHPLYETQIVEGNPPANQAPKRKSWRNSTFLQTSNFIQESNETSTPTTPILQEENTAKRLRFSSTSENENRSAFLRTFLPSNKNSSQPNAKQPESTTALLQSAANKLEQFRRARLPEPASGSAAIDTRNSPARARRRKRLAQKSREKWLGKASPAINLQTEQDIYDAISAVAPHFIEEEKKYTNCNTPYGLKLINSEAFKKLSPIDQVYVREYVEGKYRDLQQFKRHLLIGEDAKLTHWKNKARTALLTSESFFELVNQQYLNQHSPTFPIKNEYIALHNEVLKHYKNINERSGYGAYAALHHHAIKLQQYTDHANARYNLILKEEPNLQQLKKPLLASVQFDTYEPSQNPPERCVPLERNVRFKPENDTIPHKVYRNELPCELLLNSEHMHARREWDRKRNTTQRVWNIGILAMEALEKPLFAQPSVAAQTEEQTRGAQKRKHLEEFRGDDAAQSIHNSKNWRAKVLKWLKENEDEPDMQIW